MCATGYGIRRSKDLRAEIGKFPVSTNERKNMSTKTNFKRVALVAVAALGLGVLTSVAPANAAAGGITIAANGGGTTDSRGVVTTATGTTGLTNTAKMLTTGSLYITAAITGAQNAISVSGGTITSCASSGSTLVLAATGATCNNTSDVAITATVVPNAGSTAVVISQYTDNTFATEYNRVTVSVVAATTVGGFSATYSNIKAQAAADTDGTLDGTANLDDKYTSGNQYSSTYGGLSVLNVENGSKGYINFNLKDANDNAMTSSTTGLTASATGGCLVGFSSTLTGTAASTTGNKGTIYVGQAVANTPYKCVVTFAVNGATVATKTFVLQGQVTKLVVSDQVIVRASGSSTADALAVDAQDAAGNSISGVSVSAVSTTLNASVTALTTFTTNVANGTLMAATCSTTKGTNSALKVYAVNASVTPIYSDAFSLSCAGSPVNYSASLDKASYVVGEVATLTITAKDSAGNLTWDGAPLVTTTTATDAANTAVAMAGGPLTLVGAAVSTDTFTSGVKKYKFTVGGIASGSYQLVVDLPKYNSTTYSQTAVTVPYKVSIGSDAGVSNADVLKAIVSLIASINKQIAALQKALLKKK